MSISLPSNVKFYLLTSGLMLAAAAGLAAVWPGALSAAHAEASRLVGEGSKATGPEAEADFRLATVLDPGNRAAKLGLARAQIAAGRADDGLTTLASAGEGSEVTELTVRTLLELGRNNEAANKAGDLTGDENLTLAAIAYASADRKAEAEALKAAVSSQEAAERVQRAAAGSLSLATEMHATGLLNSSSVLASKLPPSYERDLLLARIRYARHGKADLAQAQELLLGALKSNPAGIEARRLLVHVYRDLRNTTAADREAALVNKLGAGRP